MILRNIRHEVGRRKKRQDPNLVFRNPITLVAVEDVFLTDFGIGQKERRVSGCVPEQVLPTFPFPVRRDLREFRLETVLKIMDRHDVRYFRLKGYGERRRIKHQVDAFATKLLVDVLFAIGPVEFRFGIGRVK